MADVKIRAGLINVNFAAEIAYPTNNFSVNQTYRGVALGFTYINENGIYVDLAPTFSKGDKPAGVTSGADANRFDGTLVLGYSEGLDNGTSASYYFGIKNGLTVSYYSDATATGGFRNLDLQSQGVIAGAGWAFPLNLGGTIVVNAGIGLLVAEASENDIVLTTSKQSLGYSYGVSYNYPISTGKGLSIDYKGNIYNYEMEQKVLAPTQIKENWSLVGISAYILF